MRSIHVLVCRLVAAFRKWLDMRAGGGPPTKLPKDLPPLVDRQEVFLNRYEQHTKHCPYCSAVSWRGPNWHTVDTYKAPTRSLTILVPGTYDPAVGQPAVLPWALRLVVLRQD